jgi:hypothetical protein
VETRLLHFLVEERRQTVDEKMRANLRLTDCLKLYFPQVLRWFDDVTSPLVGDLLERWPTLEQLLYGRPPETAGAAESSELVRQALFLDNFWKPATDFHSTPVDVPRTPASKEPRRRRDCI